MVYAFLFAPIVVLILFSFNDSKRNFAWKGFTLQLVPGAVRATTRCSAALGVTLQVALISVLVTTVLGTLLGLGLARLARGARPRVRRHR